MPNRIVDGGLCREPPDCRAEVHRLYGLDRRAPVGSLALRYVCDRRLKAVLAKRGEVDHKIDAAETMLVKDASIGVSGKRGHRFADYPCEHIPCVNYLTASS
jgi:hypothetical protein